MRGLWTLNHALSDSMMGPLINIWKLNVAPNFNWRVKVDGRRAALKVVCARVGHAYLLFLFPLFDMR